MVNTAPWQELSEALDMCITPASVKLAELLAGMSRAWVCWSVNVTPVEASLLWLVPLYAAGGLVLLHLVRGWQRSTSLEAR